MIINAFFALGLISAFFSLFGNRLSGLLPALLFVRLDRQPLCHASGPAVAHAGRPSLFESAGAVPPAAPG